jgi:hypothetical protein
VIPNKVGPTGGGGGGGIYSESFTRGERFEEEEEEEEGRKGLFGIIHAQGAISNEVGPTHCRAKDKNQH